MLQFQIRKDALATTRFVALADEPLAPGEVRVRVERFAYTANNITYAAFGEAMHYWQFFPVADDAAGWGVQSAVTVPVGVTLLVVVTVGAAWLAVARLKTLRLAAGD